MISYNINLTTGVPTYRLIRQKVDIGILGGIATLSNLQIQNDGDETPTGASLTALTARLSNDGTPIDGKELITEKWLEAKLPAGAWTPIGNGDMLSLPLLAVDETVIFELRLNVPAGASFLGTIEPVLAVIIW